MMPRLIVGVCLMAVFCHLAISPALAQYTTVDGVGWEGQGADLAIANLDGDSRPDMVLMAYDNPAQANTFRYKIGWNLNSNGVATRWDSNFVTVEGVGWEGQGAGVAIANLDGDSRPDMVLMAYDNPAQANTFRYKIGWNLNSNGVATRWDSNFVTVEGVGWEGQGAGVAIANLDGDSRPEMILMAYDNPAEANTFRYKIGWNLNSNGVAARWDSNFVTVEGVGWEGQGAGIAIANLDGNSRPDMVLMAYDNPAQANTFRYKIGWNLNNNGVAARWDSNFVTVEGVGWEGQGAGVAIENLDEYSRPEMILMAYDNPAEANTFRYKVLRNLNNNGVAT
ncbi:MAG TPA: hypothetical protein PLX30_00905 [Methanothrix sp.]|nr:hypothetical protein [Methanothrix sp.]